MILMMKMTSNGSMIIHLPTSLTGIRVNLIILVMGKTVLQSLGFSCTCTVNYTFPADGMIWTVTRVPLTFARKILGVSKPTLSSLQSIFSLKCVFVASCLRDDILHGKKMRLIQYVGNKLNISDVH